MGKDSKKKHKKDKKHKSKKDKKKKKKHYSSSSDSSSSDEWVESVPTVSAKTERTNDGDEWMGVFSGKTRKELNENKKKDEKEEKKNILDEPGRSARELNPFWKNGGTGLPSDESSSSRLSTRVGDGGAKWLRKAMQRAKEQAEEEGRPLEAVVAERWGSMSEFNQLLRDAESKNERRGYSRDAEPRERERRDHLREPEPRNERRGHLREPDPKNERRDYTREPDPRNERRDFTREPDPRNERRDHLREPDPRNERRDHLREPDLKNERRDYTREPDPRNERRDYSRDTNSRNERYHKNDEDTRDSDHHRPRSDSDRYRRREDSSNLRKLNFKRPDFDSVPSERESRPYQSSSTRKNWKKPGYEETKAPESKNESIAPSEPVKKESEKIEEIKKKFYDKDDNQLLSTPEMIDLYDIILEAEADGNTRLARTLKNKLELEQDKRVDAYNKSSTGLKDEKGRDVRLLTETDNRGFSRPAKATADGNYSRKRKLNTHEGKDRVRYFADDDKYSLQDMFEKEKFNSQTEQDATFYNLMKKAGDDDEAAFDVARIDNREKEDRRSKVQAIKKYEAREKALDNCRWCISSNKKSDNNIVLIKNKIYLAVPSFQSLTDRHCLIVPQSHVSCSTLLDEDVWDDIMDMRKILVKAFEEDDDEDIVFFESAIYIDRHPHMILHCVPVPREIGDMAPIYFKKAIMECENEWSNNKKLVELAGRNVRRAVPKGLPYFAVDFGMQSGYAHVVEDKKLFPHNFAQEIIGGMMDLDHTIWRKPKRDTPENIQKKVESLKQLLKE